MNAGGKSIRVLGRDRRPRSSSGRGTSFPGGAESTRRCVLRPGFVSEASRVGHEENWPLALQILAETLEDETG